MNIFGGIVFGLDPVGGCTGADVYCNAADADSAIEKFKANFADGYADLLEEVIADFGDCTEKEQGITPLKSITKTDFGFVIRMNSMSTYCKEGKMFTGICADEPFVAALRKLEGEVPGLTFKANIGFSFHEFMDEDYFSDDLGNDDKLVCISEALKEMLAKDPDYFWEKVVALFEILEEDETPEVENLIAELKLYADCFEGDPVETLFASIDQYEPDMLDEIADCLNKFR